MKHGEDLQGTRSARRYPLHLHVSMPGGRDAETSDISSGGVLIRCSTGYPVGSQIRFSILVPGETLGSDHDVELRCVGRVMRCDPVDGRMAVGAVIDEYTISR